MVIVVWACMKPWLFAYAVTTYIIGYWSFSVMSDSFIRAAKVRRAAFFGSEDEDHTEESMELYKKGGAIVSMFVPFLPVVAIALSLIVDNRTEKAKRSLASYCQ